jgi:hypothetical protein
VIVSAVYQRFIDSVPLKVLYVVKIAHGLEAAPVKGLFKY